MRYTGKSELLLKYQKTKAKLIEYDVPNDAYPNFPVNSNANLKPSVKFSQKSPQNK